MTIKKVSYQFDEELRLILTGRKTFAAGVIKQISQLAEYGATAFGLLYNWTDDDEKVAQSTILRILSQAAVPNGQLPWVAQKISEPNTYGGFTYNDLNKIYSYSYTIISTEMTGFDFPPVNATGDAVPAAQMTETEKLVWQKWATEWNYDAKVANDAIRSGYHFIANGYYFDESGNKVERDGPSIKEIFGSTEFLDPKTAMKAVWETHGNNITINNVPFAQAITKLPDEDRFHQLLNLDGLDTGSDKKLSNTEIFNNLARSVLGIAIIGYMVSRLVMSIISGKSVLNSLGGLSPFIDSDDDDEEPGEVIYDWLGQVDPSILVPANGYWPKAGYRIQGDEKDVTGETKTMAEWDEEFKKMKEEDIALEDTTGFLTASQKSKVKKGKTYFSKGWHEKTGCINIKDLYTKDSDAQKKYDKVEVKESKAQEYSYLGANANNICRDLSLLENYDEPPYRGAFDVPEYLFSSMDGDFYYKLIFEREEYFDNYVIDKVYIIDAPNIKSFNGLSLDTSWKKHIGWAMEATETVRDLAGDYTIVHMVPNDEYELKVLWDKDYEVWAPHVGDALSEQSLKNWNKYGWMALDSSHIITNEMRAEGIYVSIGAERKELNSGKGYLIVPCETDPIIDAIVHTEYTFELLDTPRYTRDDITGSYIQTTEQIETIVTHPVLNLDANKYSDTAYKELHAEQVKYYAPDEKSLMFQITKDLLAKGNRGYIEFVKNQDAENKFLRKKGGGGNWATDILNSAGVSWS